jgi:hypothetical protein|tara:strand:+ start:261 stop:557 length:297 start_codon:yes stop_codon:yes gene_type:complete
MSKKTGERKAEPAVQITNFSRGRLNIPVYKMVEQAGRAPRRVTSKTIQIGSAYKAKPGANRVEVPVEDWNKALEGSKMLPDLLQKGMNGGIEIRHIQG